MLVAVGNGVSYGGGMKVCPGARMDDGLFDVTVLGPDLQARVRPGLPAGLLRRPRQPSRGDRAPGECVSLAAAGVTAYADGERVALLPVTCDVVPGALHVLAP